MSDAVRSGMNMSNKLWELLEEKLLDQVFIVGASLRLVKRDEEHSETIGVCVLYRGLYGFEANKNDMGFLEVISWNGRLVDVKLIMD
ncbi:hypothetical protein A2U01_0027814 [Trifolium medium]|uniref:Uncharacterized protein n=1 Tax=Trifolium medium TaxID=97028 RepID=A0A392P4T2_9FABA|nr:hypothetical protein [Trifolium medium]